MKMCLWLFVLSLPQCGLLFGQTDHHSSELASSLILKAHEALVGNESKIRHWNWSVIERVQLISPSGRIVQDFPEAIETPDDHSREKRCWLFGGWSDGVPLQNQHLSQSERCEAAKGSKLLRISVLLESTDVKLIGRSSEQGRSGWLVELGPQVSRLLSEDFTERCTASVRAKVLIDQHTFHPLHIQGEVVWEDVTTSKKSPSKAHHSYRTRLSGGGLASK